MGDKHLLKLHRFDVTLISNVSEFLNQFRGREEPNATL